MTGDKLTRPRRGRIIAGVCAGIADHYGWSRGKVRLLFILLGTFGPGEVAYIVLWLMMPKQR